MANAKSRKPISPATKGIVCLVLLCALTVFVSFLGIAGMKLDGEGVNVLLPWVPVSSANWPASLPLNRALGGGTYIEYAAKEGASLEDTVKVINARLEGLSETDRSVTVKGDDTIRIELRNMDASRLSGVRSMAVMAGHYEFRDSEGNVLLTEKDVTGASLGMNANQTTYVVTAKITDEAVKKLADAGVTYVSVYLDNDQVASVAGIDGNEISMSFLTSNFNTASNVTYLFNTGAVDAGLTMKESGTLDASAAGTRQVVLLVALALLVIACLYLVLTGKLTGVSGIWTAWCAVLLGLFFVATIVVPTVYALNVGCLIAALLGVLLAVYTAVTRADAISAQTKEGFSPKQATKLGFRSCGKQIWLVHGCALAVSLVMMIFPFSKSTGYTLAAFVTASAFTAFLMRVFQACFTAISNKPSLFGKTK